MHNGRGLFIAALSSILFMLAAPASAQLEPTSWTEFVRLAWGLGSDQKWVGQDPTSPEPLIHSITYPNSSVDGNVTFGPPGPPFVTAHSDGSKTTFGYASYWANTQGTVTFQLRIIEKAPPPIVVDYVPLMVGIQGRAAVSGSAGAFGSAIASMVILSGNTEVLRKRSEAKTGGDPGPILLDDTNTLSIPPGVVVTGSISASVVVSLQYWVGTLIDATASVGPAFEIPSDYIPGTNSLYRDYFEIEYGPGYWALAPTPVAPTTWGKIKALYSNESAPR